MHMRHDIDLYHKPDLTGYGSLARCSACPQATLTSIAVADGAATRRGWLHPHSACPDDRWHETELVRRSQPM